MKKLLSLLMILLLPLFPAAAGVTDTIAVEQIKGEMTYNNATPFQPVLTITNLSPHDVSVTVEVYDELAKLTVQSTQFVMPVGGTPVTINGFVYKQLSHDGQINTYRYRVTSANGFKENFYAAQMMHIDQRTQQPYYTQIHNAYYPRNSVTSFGPQFRVLTPNLTKEWYMFTPVNLAQQGRQTFTLVGGNMYEVGEVFVDVMGDSVTVSYHYFYDGQTKKIAPVAEFLHFFNDYASITTVDHKKIPETFRFNQPFSINNQLGGDTNVLMFVRNTESFYHFPTPDQQLYRNAPNSEQRNAERQFMLQMMDPVEGLNLVNDHNYAN